MVSIHFPLFFAFFPLFLPYFMSFPFFFFSILSEFLEVGLAGGEENEVVGLLGCNEELSCNDREFVVSKEREEGLIGGLS